MSFEFQFVLTKTFAFLNMYIVKFFTEKLKYLQSYLHFRDIMLRVILLLISE